MELDETLQSVTACEGVASCFVSDESGRVLARSPRTPLHGESMARAARVLADTLSGLAGATPSARGTVDLVYRDGRLVVRPLPGAFLAIVCLPGTSVPLLSLRTNLALRTLAERLSSPGGPVQGRPSLREALAERVKSRLGDHAGRALSMLEAAGESPAELEAAFAQVARFARLFIDREEGEALERDLRHILMTRRT